MGDTKKDKNILVYDDHEAILEVTSIILTNAGYGVETSKTCDNLIPEILEIKPDLILMDLRIPPEGGEEAIKQIKADERTSNIPVIVFSANHKGHTVAKSAGANGFLCKPYEIDELLDMINQNLTAVNS